MNKIGIYMKDGSRYEVEAESWQSSLSDGYPSVLLKGEDGSVKKRVFLSNDVVLVGGTSGITYFPAPAESPTS